MKEKCSRRENGMITVEAVLSLVPFILVILGIISFINIFMVHNKIQYALFQAGSELTAYTYFYEVSGLRDADKEFTEDADKETEKIDNTIEKTSAFLEQLGSLQTNVELVGQNGFDDVEEELDKTVEAGEEVADAVGDLFEEPQKIVSGAAYLAMETILEKIKTGSLGWIMESRLASYLETDIPEVYQMSADEYLKAAGVEGGLSGLDFGKSQLFMDEEKKMIDVVVTYNLEVDFFKLFLKDNTIEIVQRCALPAWLDGDGQHYSEAKEE